MKFIIDKAVFEALPGAVFGAVAARVDNRAEIPALTALLSEQVKARRLELGECNLKEHPGVLPFREAFVKLSMNPNKFPCSIEALCKRVQKGADIPPINPVVDLGNAMSLKYMLPMGAHDLGRMSEDFMVRFANAQDRFTPFGGGEQETPDEHELVYVSGHTVKTRRWIWRQSEDGKIDETSSFVLFPIDGFESVMDRVVAARDELVSLLLAHFGVEAKAAVLTAEQNVFEV